MNAVIQGSHLLCTQQRSHSCTAQSLPGDGEIQSCSIPPSWVAPGSVPSGCTFPDLTQTKGQGAHFSPAKFPGDRDYKHFKGNKLAEATSRLSIRLTQLSGNSEDVWAAKTSTGSQHPLWEIKKKSRKLS